MELTARFVLATKLSRGDVLFPKQSKQNRLLTKQSLITKNITNWPLTKAKYEAWSEGRDHNPDICLLIMPHEFTGSTIHPSKDPELVPALTLTRRFKVRVPLARANWPVPPVIV